MASFVILANFTDQGIRGIKDTLKRAKAFRELAGKFNVVIKDIYWTLGRYDVVLTMESADDAAVASLMMKAGSLGNLKSHTLRAFKESEMDSIIDRL